MERRVTSQLVQIAVALMSDPGARHYGYDLMKRARVRSGTLYPTLDRMLEDGWVTDEWEPAGSDGHKRPRRYYSLTNLGRTELGAIASRAETHAGLNWGAV